MRRVLITTLLTLLPVAAAAQTSEDLQAAAPTPPARCNAAEYRQFDFWIGDWNVTSNGRPAGTNSVRSLHGGCVLQENWLGAGVGGISGSSYNIYDSARNQWHQTWVDASGTLLQLDGALVDGSMVLSGERPLADGQGTARHRIRWTPNEDGSVRQLWEASQDGGESWNVIFDGLYTRAEPPR